jgi:hypothetical protein
MLNRKWRAIGLEEMKRLPIDELEDIIQSVEWTKEESGSVWVRYFKVY